MDRTFSFGHNPLDQSDTIDNNVKGAHKVHKNKPSKLMNLDFMSSVGAAMNTKSGNLSIQGDI